MRVPVPVKVLNCLNVSKRRLTAEEIADTLNEDIEVVNNALSEFVERGLLIKEGDHYQLNLEFETVNEKILDIYRIMYSGTEKDLYWRQTGLHSGSTPLYIM
ncbi:MAG: hypothetical protein SVM80_00590 [Halobacteriota archaeon]|nr:hypothetical protein [Halobacteriota archaeon]